MEAAINTNPANAVVRAQAEPLVDVDRMIVFDNVSKFYGEILGVNRVSLNIAPGITSLVGPNGSGKTTLMNLMTGLIQPSRGRISILGVTPTQPEQLFGFMGYCAQFDSFPNGVTGLEFVRAYLPLHGYSRKQSEEMAWRALERVSLKDAAHRKVAGYSKGMRQRARLAQAIAHQPRVMILDEPLNGLDPMARAEAIALFRQLASEGLHLIISSHILHEVDTMSDAVVLMNNGYVVAEGQVRGVREEKINEHPLQIAVRCDQPSLLASRLFMEPHIVEASMHEDLHKQKVLLVRTRDLDRFYRQINQLVNELNLNIESVVTMDDDLNAVYQYLIGATGGK
ncbi:MAG: ABC transporter ATP-binding protein [Blastocatellia bacterium]